MVYGLMKDVQSVIESKYLDKGFSIVSPSKEFDFQNWLYGQIETEKKLDFSQGFGYYNVNL